MYIAVFKLHLLELLTLNLLKISKYFLLGKFFIDIKIIVAAAINGAAIKKVTFKGALAKIFVKKILCLKVEERL